MTEIIVKSQTTCLTAENNKHRTRLNKERDERIIPEGYDISGVNFTNQPAWLVNVNILCMGSIIASFDQNNLPNLASFPIYVSLSPYAYIDIELEFDKNWLEKQEEYEMVDEIIEEVEHSDTEIEVFDGAEYHIGKVVRRKLVPTGRKVRKVIKGVEITIPSMTFKIKKNNKTSIPRIVEVPVRQKINTN